MTHSFPTRRSSDLGSFARSISRTAVLPSVARDVSARLLSPVRRQLGDIGGGELLLAKSQERQRRYRRRHGGCGGQGLRRPGRCLMGRFRLGRSEERRVGKECVSRCRSRGGLDTKKKKNYKE